MKRHTTQTQLKTKHSHKTKKDKLTEDIKNNVYKHRCKTTMTNRTNIAKKHELTALQENIENHIL